MPLAGLIIRGVKYDLDEARAALLREWPPEWVDEIFRTKLRGRRWAKYTVTELTGPIYQTYLKASYPYYEIAESKMPQLIGTAVHRYFANKEAPPHKIIAGVGVSGMPDWWSEEDETLYDLKVSSFWKAYRLLNSEDVNESEYAYQLNAYNWLSDMRWKRLAIRMVCRDWSKRLVKDVQKWNGKVAPGPVEIFPVRVVDWWTMRAWLTTQVLRLESALLNGAEDYCSKEERWNDRRCEGYCPVNGHCVYWQDHCGKEAL